MTRLPTPERPLAKPFCAVLTSVLLSSRPASRERVVAVLSDDSDTGTVETEALELLAAVAGSVLQARSEAPADLVRIAPIKPSALDLKARRFARTRVAEIRLHRSAEVKTGR